MKQLTQLLLLITLFASCQKQAKNEHADKSTAALATMQNVGLDAKIEYEVSSDKVQFVLNLFDQMSKQEAVDIQNPYVFTDTVDEIDPDAYPTINEPITYEYTKYQAVDNKIILPLRNGKSLTLENNSEEHYNDAMVTYRYVGRIEKLEKYVVEAYFWERYACLIIDQNDGTIETMPSIPQFNNKLTKMATCSYDLYEGGETKLFIYNIVDKQFKISHTTTYSELSDVKITWPNNNLLDVLTISENSTNRFLISVFNEDERKPLASEWWGKYTLQRRSIDIDDDEYYHDYNFTINELSVNLHEISNDSGYTCSGEYWAHQDNDKIVALHYIGNDNDCNGTYYLQRIGGDVHIVLDKYNTWQKMKKVDEFEKEEDIQNGN